MKIKITENEEKFEPFDVTLTIESEDEARLLWHVFNHGNLVEALLYDENYWVLDYIIPENQTTLAVTENADSLRQYIMSKVKI